ncbi:HEAT repeat domain-containing protein [Pedobacter hiemivivus]|uniref:HEAT repeat domain-containing protein n=1 Tax=Pedobacter hiemivivus TaxID=2530454 RepID=A0A4R0NKZ5_9SPHI|nr:HEAT repeat domain-containing protein [Pedobacter hiemivivus]TCC99664.1 HEAT repeat domain-containing protein [Pedobacter hiemivivus]
MDIKNLYASYEALKQSENPYDIIFDFKEELLSSDSDEFLDFHYLILQDKDLSDQLRGTLKSFFYSEVVNNRNKEVVSSFLYQKYTSGIEDISLRADVIQLLGNLRSKHAKEVALENIALPKADLRYRSIIVLGWIGTKIDLKVLNERLLTDRDPQLRGYAATAMRQIWFNHPKSKEEILKHIKEAIPEEKEEKALQGMIITVQELLKKKLGLKESKYGDITGDIEASKVKAIAALEAY